MCACAYIYACVRIYSHIHSCLCASVCFHAVCVFVCLCARVCLKLYGSHVWVLSCYVDCIRASNCDECSEIGESTDFDCQWCPQLSRCTHGDLIVYYAIVYL